VKPGRSISGRVVTADHRPAPGANIFGGSVIIGDGTQPGNVGVGIGQGGLSTLFLAANGGQPPIQTTSDADGQFTLVARGSNDLVLLADHPDLGRSSTVTVPGSSDPQTVELVLSPFASLDGTVTENGNPTEGVAVTATSQASTGATWTVTTGPDGKF